MDSQASTTANTPMPSTRDVHEAAAAGAAPAGAGSASCGLGALPEGKVAVWDDTMKQVVVKDKEDVKLEVRCCCVWEGDAVYEYLST